nr:aminopeptidase [Paenibacillus spongiae]
MNIGIINPGRDPHERPENRTAGQERRPLLCQGEKLLIEVEGHDTVLAKAIALEAYHAGAYPFVVFTDKDILRTQLLHSPPEQLECLASYDFVRMNDMDAYVLIRADANDSELSDVPPEKIHQYWKVYYHHVHGPRWEKTKWCILRYPNAAAAQRAKMSTEKFEELYFSVCNLDYSKLSGQMDALVRLLNQTDKVRITGEGTDLTLSIKGMPVRKDAGLQNLPDVEVYCVPIKDSVHGSISFNTPVNFRGTTFDNIALTFEHGKSSMRKQTTRQSSWKFWKSTKEHDISVNSALV